MQTVLPLEMNNWKYHQYYQSISSIQVYQTQYLQSEPYFSLTPIINGRNQSWRRAYFSRNIASFQGSTFCIRAKFCCRFINWLHYNRFISFWGISTAGFSNFVWKRTVIRLWGLVYFESLNNQVLNKYIYVNFQKLQTRFNSISST